MADIVEILQKAGASTFADLTSLVSARAVRSALAAGRIRRLAKGVYALPEQADPMTVARAHGGVLSHQSAAIAWGFQVLTRPLAPHVTIHRNLHLRNVKLPCVLHRQDVPELDGLTTPLRTVLDCARSLPFGEALTVADSALRLGAISTSELLAAADQASGNGCRQIRRVAEFADSRAESALESMLRSRVLDAGFTGFVPQTVIADDGYFARVDLAEQTRRIAVEADSFAHHASREALARDCRRYTNLAIRGWTLLRFSWEDVILDDHWVGFSLQQMMRGRPGPHGVLQSAA